MLLKSRYCISELDEVFKLCCPVGTEHRVNLQLPSTNLARYSAMEWVARYCLTPLELKRIEISGSLCNVVSKLLSSKDLDSPDTVSESVECDFWKAHEIQSPFIFFLRKRPVSELNVILQS